MPEDEAQKTDPEAMAIYQAHLDRATAATLAADYDAFAACISFPWRVKTADLDLCFDDDEAHRKNFALFSSGLKAENITGFHRLVHTAFFVAPDVIEGTHISHMMRNSARVHDPYFNRIRLVRHPQHGWRETDCTNAVLTKAGNFAIFDTRLMDLQPPDLQDLPERKTND